VIIPILIGVAVVIAIGVVLVMLRPADFRISRSITIAAPAAAVFPEVNTLRNWEEWSPWAKIDPNVRNTYTGPASGDGAVFDWSGNNKVGAGRMTIVESQPDQRVRFRLEFLRPFKTTNTAEFLFTSDASKTDVNWSMWGKNNFFTKVFGLFVSMDRLIGKDFEKGLANLKTRVEQKQ